MPYKWTEPEIVLEHAGITVYCCYKDGWWDRPLRYSFTTDMCEREDAEFDVRDLPVPNGVDHNDHKAIICAAIDEGLITQFEEEE